HNWFLCYHELLDVIKELVPRQPMLSCTELAGAVLTGEIKVLLDVVDRGCLNVFIFQKVSGKPSGVLPRLSHVPVYAYLDSDRFIQAPALKTVSRVPALLVVAEGLNSLLLIDLPVPRHITVVTPAL